MKVKTEKDIVSVQLIYMDFEKLIKTDEYAFLRREERLRERVILLGVSGSYAYGTQTENSDVDLRGVTLNMPSDLIGMTSFEQYEDRKTDTVIFAFNKFLRMLMGNNPNILELLGLNDYLIKTDIGSQLLAQRHLFFSRRAAVSFRNFADAQMRKLQNASARDRVPEEIREEHILNSVRRALVNFNECHQGEDHQINLYIDDEKKEIVTDAVFRNYPLRQYNELMNTLHSVVRDYDRAKERARKDDAHLNKHAMHLVRLYMTGTDLLNSGEIITRRPPEDLCLLRKIRNGEYMADGTMTLEYYSIVSEYAERFKEAAENTKLPDEPDRKKIAAFAEKINRQVVTEG